MNSELRTRILGGGAAAIVGLFVMLKLGPECTFLAAVIAGMLGWREYTRMMGIQERSSLYLPGFLIVILMFTHTYFIGVKSMFWIWLSWAFGFFTLFFHTLKARRAGAALEPFDPARVWTELCRFLLGIIYIFMLFGFVGPIAAREHGEAVLIFSLFVIFMGDTTAYFVGRRLGGEKIWPELSPGKTVAGCFGGWIGSFVGSVIAYAVARRFAPGAVNLTNALIIGFVVPPLAQAGDFLESLMKRAAGFKDSGTLIPGHGGILDRMDGLAFAMPFIYFLF